MQPCCCWTAFFNSVVQMLPFLAVLGVFGERILKVFSKTAQPKPVEEVATSCCGDVH